MPATDLAGVPGVHDLRTDDGQIRFDVDGNRLDDVVARLASLGVLSLTSHPPTLEELFLRHYSDELAEVDRRTDPWSGADLPGR